MKKIYILLSIVMLALTACEKGNEFQYFYPAPEDTMKATASKEAVEINVNGDLDQEAVFFSWNPAKQREAGAEITYYFKFYLASDSPASVEKIELAPMQLTYSLTARQIVDYLRAKGVVTGMQSNMIAEVIADIQSTTYMKPEISYVGFSVTTEKK